MNISISSASCEPVSLTTRAAYARPGLYQSSEGSLRLLVLEGSSQAIALGETMSVHPFDFFAAHVRWIPINETISITITP